MENASKQVVREEYESYWIPPMTFRVVESFEEFVALNPDLMVEQNRNGETVIVSPAGSESASRNAEISYQLQQWSKSYSGKTFDSSVLFTLPDGSKRGPDASWIAKRSKQGCYPTHGFRPLPTWLHILKQFLEFSHTS